jgi:5-methyltetrahydropteroyltriglutamate--homocysteine methyltransferase
MHLGRSKEAISRAGRPTPVPRIVGPVQRSHPVLLRDVEFLRAATDRQIKVTVPGPFTMTRLVQDEYYNDEDALIAAYADAVNAELRDLKSAGADVIQLDEPYLQSHAEQAAVRGVEALDRALDGIEGPTAVHLCFGYAYVVKGKPSGYSFLAELEGSSVDQISIEAAQPGINPAALEPLKTKSVIYGVLDLDNHAVETPAIVADRIRGALEHIPADRLILAPDCGMKYLPRDVAFGKLAAMVAGRDIVLAEIA